MKELDPLVSEYQHEKNRAREAEALKTLQRIASIVKPIMRRRNWRVGTLCEFYPPESNLLGLNYDRGRKICLRLRYPGDDRQFMPLEDVVDTMLHELCHNVIGPHNEDFHNLWNQLRDEHEQLIRKGYTGEGFLGKGNRVGGARLPPEEARRRARAAAEKRRTLTAGSGQKLGGAPIMRGVDIRKIIADAAQRRTTVTKGCASGTNRDQGLVEEASKNGFKTKAEEDDANERAIMQAYIDLIEEDEKEKYGDGYVPPSAENPAGPLGATSSQPTPQAPPIPISSKPEPLSSSKSTPSTRPAARPPPPPPSASAPVIDLTDTDLQDPSDNATFSSPWTCPICTLQNPATYLCCDACTCERPEPTHTSRPAQPSSSRSSSRNQTTDTDNERPSIFKPRQSATRQIMELERKAPKKDGPIGWVCRCGNFMENEWWTCAGCGRMKESS